MSVNGQMPSMYDDNPFRYRGEYLDTQTGKYYLRARYYDPSIGRFTQEDTRWNVGNMVYDSNGSVSIEAIFQSGNLYNYCGGDPVNRMDPTGEAWYHWAIGAAIVVAAGVAVVVTAGGALPAMMAVGSMASGVAAATTASTVAAGAFIGAAGAYGGAALLASMDAKSIEEFNAKGNWGTVAFTVAGAIVGVASTGAVGKTPYKTLDKGVNFGSTALKHMQESGRFVPVQALIDTIKIGASMNDPQKSQALMYYAQITINNKIYQLEVLYDKASNCIWHFKYYN